MRPGYLWMVSAVLCLVLSASRAAAEVSVPAQGDVMSEDYASYFFYDNGYAGYTNLGGVQLSVDRVERKAGNQSVVFDSNWETYDYNAKVGVYSGGAATPWVLDNSYSAFLWVKLQGPVKQDFWLVMLDSAGNRKKFDNYSQWGPQVAIQNNNQWVPLMIPLDRFAEDPDDAGGNFDPSKTVAMYLVYYGAASASQGDKAFRLWLDDVRFIKHTFDQPWPNVCADAFSEYNFNLSALGVNEGPLYNQHLSVNTTDKVVGNQSLAVVDPGNAWPGTARFGMMGGASDASLMALGSAAWYFDGWVKMDPVYNKSNYMMAEDADGNYIRWWQVFDRISAGGWVHLYLPLSRLTSDNDKSASFDWSRLKKLYMGYYTENGGNNGATTLLDGWRLIPYAGAKQMPPLWADAFSENYKDHFGVSAISEAVESNMNGADLTVDTANKVAGSHSIKFVKPGTWDASWWFYIGAYSGGAAAPWVLAADWTLHVSIMVQGAPAGYTRYFEIKDVNGNILRYDLGPLLSNESNSFTTLNLKLSDFEDTSSGAFDYTKVTKALLRLNSAGTPTVWIDNLYFTAPQADVAVSPAQLRFTEGTGFEVDVEKQEAGKTQNVVITNNGVVPLHFTGGHYATPGLAIFGTDAADWQFVSPVPDTSAALAPGASLMLGVKFAPSGTTRATGKSATLEITTDDLDQPVLSIPLTGDAVPVELGSFSAE